MVHNMYCIGSYLKCEQRSTAVVHVCVQGLVSVSPCGLCVGPVSLWMNLCML